MPLIEITTRHPFHPLSSGGGTVNQKMTADFGRALPALFVGNIKKLRLDADTPETGVQITHKKFHGQDVNAPDMWVLVQFSESGLTTKQQIKVRKRVKELLLGWFEEKGITLPENFACDCFWGPSHGFLKIKGVQAEW